MSMSFSKKSHFNPFFVYPEKVGGVAVTIADFRTLEQEVYLNDVVVDFYMLFLLNHVLSEDQRCSLHVFMSSFFKRLTISFGSNVGDDGIFSLERHSRVKNWT